MINDLILYLSCFYIIATILNFAVISAEADYIWENIQKDGFKVKHLFNIIFFFPVWLLLSIVILIFYLFYLCHDSKIWKKVKVFLNKPIWKKKQHKVNQIDEIN